VEALLDRGFLTATRDPAVTIGAPLPVVDAAARQHSWFVPLQAGSKLAGFAQLSPNLEPLRVSSFQRGPSSGYDGCPDTADWTDPQRIRERAATLANSGERLSEPVLSFDQEPSRLAWRVEAETASGEKRVLYVAGTAAYAATGARGLG
jgi:hypothetical protein